MPSNKKKRKQNDSGEKMKYSARWVLSPQGKELMSKLNKEKRHAKTANGRHGRGTS